MNFEGEIKRTDKVCYSCCKSPLVVLRESSATSQDENLQELISTLEQVHAAVKGSSTDQRITLNRMAIHAGGKESPYLFVYENFAVRISKDKQIALN